MSHYGDRYAAEQATQEALREKFRAELVAKVEQLLQQGQPALVEFLVELISASNLDPMIIHAVTYRLEQRDSRTQVNEEEK